MSRARSLLPVFASRLAHRAGDHQARADHDSDVAQRLWHDFLLGSLYLDRTELRLGFVVVVGEAAQRHPDSQRRNDDADHDQTCAHIRSPSLSVARSYASANVFAIILDREDQSGQSRHPWPGTRWPHSSRTASIKNVGFFDTNKMPREPGGSSRGGGWSRTWGGIRPHSVHSGR